MKRPPPDRNWLHNHDSIARLDHVVFITDVSICEKCGARKKNHRWYNRHKCRFVPHVKHHWRLSSTSPTNYTFACTACMDYYIISRDEFWGANLLLLRSLRKMRRESILSITDIRRHMEL